MNGLLILEDMGSTVSNNLGISDKLVPNLWAFLTQFFAFIVMCVFVIVFAYKPIHKYLQKRQDYIKTHLDSTLKNDTEAQKANAEAQQRLNESKKEGSKIIEAARVQAQKDKVQYEAELQKELALKRAQAEKDIELEKKKALAEVQDQIVDIALQASSSLMKREVDTDDNRKYVQDFVKDYADKKEETQDQQ